MQFTIVFNLCFFEWREPGGQSLPASIIMWRWGCEGAHMYSLDDPPESNRRGYVNVAGL